MWATMRGELEHDDEVFLLFFLLMHSMAPMFREIGPGALIWRMHSRPSAGLSGSQQAQIFQAMDGMRARHGVGLAVVRQDNHSVPLLLLDLGATLRFGGTFYTPLTKEELETAGGPGRRDRALLLPDAGPETFAPGATARHPHVQRQ